MGQGGMQRQHWVMPLRASKVCMPSEPTCTTRDRASDHVPASRRGGFHDAQDRAADEARCWKTLQFWRRSRCNSMISSQRMMSGSSLRSGMLTTVLLLEAAWYLLTQPSAVSYFADEIRGS